MPTNVAQGEGKMGWGGGCREGGGVRQQMMGAVVKEVWCRQMGLKGRWRGCPGGPHENQAHDCLS